jgi:integrase
MNTLSARIVTPEEEAQMVFHLRNTEHIKRRAYFSDIADLIEVLIDTGMWSIEFEELLYRDVKFESNLLIIRSTKSNHRLIPMTKRVAAIMKKRMLDDQHKPFNLNDIQIYRGWTWAKEQIGMKDDKGLVLYALRRTCAIRLVTAGVRLNIIHQWLGHSGIRPIPPKKLIDAAKKLEKITLPHSR